MQFIPEVIYFQVVRFTYLRDNCQTQAVRLRIATDKTIEDGLIGQRIVFTGITYFKRSAFHQNTYFAPLILRLILVRKLLIAISSSISSYKIRIYTMQVMLLILKEI
jgi:hypothetical protein